MNSKMTTKFKVLFAALILVATLATADSNSANITHPNNSLIAVQPTIAKPSVYNTKNNKTDKNSQNKDILITTPKNIIGGSGRQDNDISRYLGINY